mgnify:CR=1 FL=1
MDLFDIMAYIGGSILASQMIPQIIKIVKHRSAKDISHIFLFLNVIGLSFMCTYGFHIKDRPLSITTGISLFNTLIMMMVKVYYDHGLSFANDIL